MNIHIPTKYLWYGGLAVAAGLAFWYLKSNGYWDQWFNASGQLIPAGPAAQPTPPAAEPIVPGTQSYTPPSGFGSLVN
jgi:hypothetical protein